MCKGRLCGMIESFLFLVGDEGLTIQQLIMLTDEPKSDVLQALQFLEEHYEQNDFSGLSLKQFGGAYQLVTKAAFSEDIKRLLENPAPSTMTKASLEVLAIIAYKQPVTRVEIDHLRGVKSEGPLHTLIARGFILEQGRSETTGRAILYGTTQLFLDRFGLESIEDLPPLLEEDSEVEQDPDLFMMQFQEVFAIEEDGGGNNA